MTEEKKIILDGIRPPGWEQLSAAGREAVLDELADLPEDVGPGEHRATAPVCERLTEVIDALRRASERPGLSDDDRKLIAGWTSVTHAGAITAFLDMATIGARSMDAATVRPGVVGELCMECGETIASGERCQQVMRMRSGDEPSVPVGALAVIHSECLAMTILGHRFEVCSCNNYAGQPTRRKAALEFHRRFTESMSAMVSALFGLDEEGAKS